MKQLHFVQRSSASLSRTKYAKVSTNTIINKYIDIGGNDCYAETRNLISTSMNIARRFQSSSSSSSLSRYGLGGHNWKSFNPESYQELIRTALTASSNNQHHTRGPVSHLEVAGQEGGDYAMVGALQSLIERTPEVVNQPLTITTRIGYRTLEVGDAAEQQPTPLPTDVILKEEGDEVGKEGADQTLSTPSNMVVHNLSPSIVEETVRNSPLWELQSEWKHLHLIYLVQNPEVQVLDLLKDSPGASLDDRTAWVASRLHPALETLQEYSKNQGQGGNEKAEMTFGIVSNGLGIPKQNNHPMHLDVETVIHAANTFDRFSTVQLPANLLETHGWEMARRIHEEVPQISVEAIRPLTCYPDLGTGTGHPFRLVDYSLPSVDGNPYAPLGNGGDDDDPPFGTIDMSSAANASESKTNKKQSTHEMNGVPAIYQIALQTAMSHFDAEEILELKQDRDLTMEERETLDGCRLVQSMIHDLDVDLDRVRSFAAHEEELYGRIIPLLYDTFEAMDDHTSDVLQAYFAAYAVAVRYAIAKKTRQVLREGDEAGASVSAAPKYPDIPPSMPLQEYAIRHMLAEPAFDRIIIGASTLQDFKHLSDLFVSIVEEVEIEGASSPLDAIGKANDEIEQTEEVSAAAKELEEKKE